jgi:hypothetical protein
MTCQVLEARAWKSSDGPAGLPSLPYRVAEHRLPFIHPTEHHSEEMLA